MSSQQRTQARQARQVSAALRSVLFAPGNDARKLERVFSAGADAVVLDLEDSVATAEKPAARAVAVAAMRQPRAPRGYIRVNAVNSEFCQDDLAAVIGPWIDGIVLPKVEEPAALQAVDQRIGELERQAGLQAGQVDLIPLIETARGIVAVDAIAVASARVRCLAFGAADYTHDLDLIWTPEETELLYARARLAHASRVAGLEPPIDVAILQVRDLERFRLSAQNGRRMGFAGKLCLHPDQVAACNEVFSPTQDEIARARAVIRAFEAAEAQGSAAIELDGQFIDYPVVYKAQRVLALAERLGHAGPSR